MLRSSISHLGFHTARQSRPVGVRSIQKGGGITLTRLDLVPECLEGVAN
jgi:hypothetical protein